MIAAEIVIPYGWTGYAAMQGASLAIPLGFLKFSRGFEAEADMLGLQYMYKTGYDPTAFVDFFEKIQTLEKKAGDHVESVFDASSDRRPHRYGAEKYSNNLEGQAGIRSEHFGV